MDTTTPKPLKNLPKLTISLDFRLLSVLLAVIIVCMVFMWRPWEQRVDANTRTIQVTGQTTVKSEPDEYVFNPYYQFENADQQTSVNQANTKSDEIVKKLKTLGVADKSIKTTASGYNTFIYRPENKSSTYTLSLTVTVDSKELAQKVQDYLVTTAPQGSVTPGTFFSEAKRKQLENQAREAATKDARNKAEQTAKNLGFKIGTVKTVTDGQGFGITPYAMDANGSSIAVDSKSEQRTVAPAATIQPGQNDLTYSVTVTYYLK